LTAEQPDLLRERFRKTPPNESRTIELSTLGIPKRRYVILIIIDGSSSDASRPITEQSGRFVVRIRVIVVHNSRGA